MLVFRIVGLLVLISLLVIKEGVDGSRQVLGGGGGGAFKRRLMRYNGGEASHGIVALRLFGRGERTEKRSTWRK